MKKDKFVEKLLEFKAWLLGFGIGSSMVLAGWWVVKFLVCVFSGICLLP